MADKKPEARPGSLEMAHDAAAVWRYMAPAGVTLAMVLEPDYWTNVVREAGQTRVPGRHAWNKIEVLAEDGTWEAELRVMAVVGTKVHVRLLRETREPSVAESAAAPDGYTVEHVTGNGWRARDRKGQVITEKRQTRDQALMAAVAHHDDMKGKR